MRRRGAAVIEADEIARKLVQRGTPLLGKVIAEFGERFLTNEGELDRAGLADLVFQCPEARERLNRLMHPPMVAMIRREITRLRKQQKPPKVVVIVAAVLFEMGLDREVDTVIGLIADEKKKLARLRQRGIPAERARQILKSQMPDGELRQRAQWILATDGAPAHTFQKLDLIWSQLLYARGSDTSTTQPQNRRSQLA